MSHWLCRRTLQISVARLAGASLRALKDLNWRGESLLESPPMPDSPVPVATPLAIETPSTGTGDDLEARVVVHNCDCHTYQQVIALFCQCIPGMTPSKAFELAWKIDHQGEAVVFTGGLKQAEEIAGKLAGGGLRVTVQ